MGNGQWAISGVTLIVHARPPRTAGYRDLVRDSELVELLGKEVRVASLLDLIRVLEGDGFSHLRPFGAALWATLESVRRRQARGHVDVAAA